MRLWSLHPRYLDRAGLVALWREGLLARAVLSGTTLGYREHPQLIRFQQSRRPLACIDTYLEGVFLEAARRGYDFDWSKLGRARTRSRMTLTQGQLDFEWRHLRRKLHLRDRVRARAMGAGAVPTAHAIFRIGPGPVAWWERGPGAHRPVRAVRSARKPRPVSKGKARTP